MVLRTADKTIGRTYVFADGRVSSRSGIAADANFTLVFKTAEIGARLLMPPIDQLEQIEAMKNFLFHPEGPDAEAVWFAQTVMTALGAGWKIGRPAGDGTTRYCTMTNGGPLFVYVKDGKIVRTTPIVFDGDDAPPYTIKARGKTFTPPRQTSLAPHGQNWKAMVYAPNRLLTPLKRVDFDPDGERNIQNRGISSYEPIGWDEAYALAAEGVARAREAGGADAVALYRGNPAVHDFGTLLGANVITRALGSKNVYSAGPNDTWPRYVQSASMYGGPLRATVPDVDRTDHLLVLGGNPLVSNGSLMTAPDMAGRLRALRERGGTLVVVDPRRTETAAVADQRWSPLPRPRDRGGVHRGRQQPGRPAAARDHGHQ